MKIEDFKEVVKSYKTLFFDIWGVVHNGIDAYPGVVDLINSLNKTHQLYFLSNAPRTNTMIAEYLQTFGLEVSEKNVMTSGAQTYIYFSQNPDAKIYAIGHEYVPDLHLPELHFTSDIKESTHILGIAYHTDKDDLNQYDDILREGAKRSVTFVCANPDTAVIHGDETRYCAGYFAEKYEKFGGKVLMQGKPDSVIYETLANRIANFDKKTALMIGDTFATDVRGANEFQIDSALVLTGNFGREIERLMRAKDIDHNSAYEEILSKSQDKPTTVVWGAFAK